MRRVWFVVITVWGLVLSLVTPALAREPSAPPPVPAGPPPETICSINDSRLIELSGLAAVDSGYITVNDSNNNASAIRISFLDRKCKQTKQVSFNPSARDPEDLAVARDGTVWVADVGDNLDSASRRDTIALWKLAPNSNTPVVFRVEYPDGPHDAEALLLNGDGNPLIITKEPKGTAQIYTPSGALQPNSRTGVRLKNVGTFTPTRTGTANFLSLAGQILVTGGANAPDGRRVALRTYSDAYEWDVPDGDVVKAITTGKPRITPLPNEANGEALAYTTDGKSFLTVTDTTGPTKILKYVPSSGAAPAGSRDGSATAAKRGDARPWYRRLSLPQIINLVAAVGVFGLILVLIGVVGIRRSRKARRRAAAAAREDSGADAAGATGADPENDQPTSVLPAVDGRGQPVRPAGGGAGQVFAPTQPGVYSSANAQPATRPPSNGVPVAPPARGGPRPGKHPSGGAQPGTYTSSAHQPGHGQRQHDQREPEQRDDDRRPHDQRDYDRRPHDQRDYGQQPRAGSGYDRPGNRRHSGRDDGYVSPPPPVRPPTPRPSGLSPSSGTPSGSPSGRWQSEPPSTDGPPAGGPPTARPGWGEPGYPGRR